MIRYLLVVLLVACSLGLKFDTMDSSKMQNLRRFPDYNHHFLFFHQPTLEKLSAGLERWASDTDVRFYMNDCKSNKLNECQNPQKTPFILVYNRVLFKYNGDFQDKQQVFQWIQDRIAASPKYLPSLAQLQAHLATHNNLFCYCSNTAREQQQSLFYSLSKSMPFINFCILPNSIMYEQLGLKYKNLTYFLNSTTNRRQYEHRNQYQAWQWFVRQNMMPKLTRVQDIVNQRFEHKQKNINTVAIACDLSYRCEQLWTRIMELQDELVADKLGYDFKLIIQDGKGIAGFNLYYHFAFNMAKFPALAHIQLKSNGQGSGKLIRRVQYFTSQLTLKMIDDFKTRADKGQIDPLFLSAQVPKKNGFTGKGAQKLIQKLVASNVRKQIQDSPNHYLLLITAFGVGCQQCDEFYGDYKQVASLVSSTDLTFGVIDINQNEVDFDKIATVPELLLFRKDDKEKPIRMQVHHSFDHLMLFLKNNLGEQYANTDQL